MKQTSVLPHIIIHSWCVSQTLWLIIMSGVNTRFEFFK